MDEFILRKYNLTKSCIQPTLHGRYSEINALAKPMNKGIDGPPSYQVLLAPEFCCVSGLSPNVATYVRCGRHIMAHVSKAIEHYAHLDLLQQKLALKFNNIGMLRQVFTHVSYSNEKQRQFSSYERSMVLVVHFLTCSRIFG